MIFEILVEDASGEKMLEAVLPKIIGAEGHTVRLHHYHGRGRLPKGLGMGGGSKAGVLLKDLPGILRGYGLTHAKYPKDCPAAVVVVCDLDADDEREFVVWFRSVLESIDKGKRPDAHFCLAIEEGEAWLLGDRRAVLAAYPRAKSAVLKKYKQDRVCGTWEVLADAVYPGGHEALKANGDRAVGAEKSRWAERIAPLMDVGRNRSPSFRRFVECLEGLANAPGQ